MGVSPININCPWAEKTNGHANLKGKGDFMKYQKPAILAQTVKMDYSLGNLCPKSNCRMNGCLGGKQ
jgi:hypothetical protein